MTAIGKGDWVEFVGKPAGYVNPGPKAPTIAALLTPGSVHLVLEVGRQCVDGAGQIWDSLVIPGMPLNAQGRISSVPAAAFKPISGGRKGMFDDMLTMGIPAGELVAA